jgi:zinc transport system ATP-binding protein
MEPIINIENVTHTYENTTVLKNISFTVNKKDFLGIIGPNGSGKTTLLKIILGIIPPKKGTIKLFKKELRHFREWKKIGYVPQNATNIEKNFPATVYEVVSMGLLSSKKIPKFITAEDEKKIKNALSIVKMEKFEKKRITELSGGQQQRVLIAKALSSEPEILVLDEPTTGIDPENQQAFYELLGKLNQQGLTILLVSHDIGRITRHVTKVASVNQILSFYGTHAEFCSKDPAHKHEHTLCLNRG